MAKPEEGNPVNEDVVVKQVKPARPKRIPVSGNRDILTVNNKDPNYMYRWVADKDNRIEKFELGGYERVLEPKKVGQSKVDSGTQLGSAVTKYGGGGVTLVLMRIPVEWYEADQKLKQESVNAGEEEIFRSTRKDGFYGSYTPQRQIR